MPTMNGFELYQKIREIDKNIKVRFLTASEINYEDQNYVIRKPIENQKLLNAVNELMK
jgi:two-component SAPR family response regulator